VSKKDWEILEINVEVEKRKTFSGNLSQYEIREFKRKRLSRLRVIVDGRLGVDISARRISSLDEQLDRAIRNAMQGLKVNFTFGQGMSLARDKFLATRPSSALEWSNLQHPEVLEIERQDIEFNLRTQSGQNAFCNSSRTIATFGVQYNTQYTFPITRLDTHSSTSDPLEILRNVKTLPVNNETEIFSNPWLISPLALSAIALEELYNYLTTDSSDAKTLPQGLWIQDRGLGTQTDLEGTIRCPVTFVQDGQLLTKAHDLYSAEISATQPTGHGGIFGRVIEDMLVGPAPTLLEEKLAPSGESYVIVINAHCFLGNSQTERLVALSLMQSITTGCLKKPPVTIFVRLCSIVKLFRKARWCGSIQRGIGPWSSSWLEITDPLSLFKSL
jgi:hypothetical protein